MQIIKITNDSKHLISNTRCVSKVILNSDVEPDMIENKPAKDCPAEENLSEQKNSLSGTLQNSFIQRSKSAITNNKERVEVRSGF